MIRAVAIAAKQPITNAATIPACNFFFIPKKKLIARVAPSRHYNLSRCCRIRTFDFISCCALCLALRICFAQHSLSGSDPAVQHESKDHHHSEKGGPGPAGKNGSKRPGTYGLPGDQ